MPFFDSSPESGIESPGNVILDPVPALESDWVATKDAAFGRSWQQLGTYLEGQQLAIRQLEDQTQRGSVQAHSLSRNTEEKLTDLSATLSVAERTLLEENENTRLALAEQIIRVEASLQNEQEAGLAAVETTLRSLVEEENGRISALAERIDQTTARLETAAFLAETEAGRTMRSLIEVEGGRISALSELIDETTARLVLTEGELEAQASAAESLRSEVESLDGSLSAQAEKSLELEATVTAQGSTIAANFTSLTQSLADETAARTTAVSNLSAQVDGDVAGLQTQVNARATITYVDQAVVDATSGLASAASVSSLAASRNRIFWETSAPTAENTGDLWFKTDAGNQAYRWSGSAWIAEDTPEAATVQTLSSAVLDAQGNAKTKYGVYLNASGEIAGLELTSSSEGSVATSQLDFVVDRISMRLPGVTQSVFDFDSSGLDIRGSISIGSSYLSQSGIGYEGIRMASVGDLQVLDIGDDFQLASKASDGADPYLLLNGTAGNSTRVTRGALSLGNSGAYPHILLNRDFGGGIPAIYLRRSASIGITLVDNVLSCLGSGAAMWIDGLPVATQTWVQAQGYSTQSADLTGYATQQWVTDQSYLTSGALANYAQTGTSNTVEFGTLRLYEGINIQPSGAGTPLFAVNSIATTIKSLSVINDADIGGQTVATQTWVNGRGFLTSHQSLAGYATQSWVSAQGYLTSSPYTPQSAPALLGGVTDVASWSEVYTELSRIASKVDSLIGTISSTNLLT